MEPKFKKTRRKGDLRQPWEYQGWLIHSSKSGMYNMVNWSANKDGHKAIVASSLKYLCLKIDQVMEAA
mgnify:CR=1 FL=1